MAETTGGPLSEEHDKQPNSEQATNQEQRQGQVNSLGSDVITIITENTEFLVDRHKIFEASDFFRAACSGNWIEARERTVVLDGIPARYFTLYVDWVYNKSLPSTPCFDAPFDGWIGEPVVEPEWTGLQLHFWCQLWIFADFLGDKGLMKFCLRAIERHVEWRGANRFFPIFLPETVELLLNETSERSDLREWIPMMWWKIPCFRRMMSFKVMGFAHLSGKN